jgi:hypothetical protein
MVLQVVISVTHSFQGLPELEKSRELFVLAWPNGASQWTEGPSISRGPGHIFSVYLALHSIQLVTGTWSSLNNLKGCDRQVVNPRRSPSVRKTNAKSIKSIKSIWVVHLRIPHYPPLVDSL